MTNSFKEVTNRFKGFDLLGRMTEKLWKEVSSIVQEVLTKIITEEKKYKKSKWLSEEALQIAEKRSERQRRKEKIYPSDCRVPKNSKET